MPDKPTWYGQLGQAVSELNRLPRPWVDRATVQQILGVGRRRAQQILQPCVTHRIGASGVADRDVFVRHLEQLAHGEAATYEQRRRQRLAGEITQLRQAWLDHPRLLIEAPSAVINQQFAGLEGVSVNPGSIIVEFQSPQSALERLLALAMAISNDFTTFEQLASVQPQVL